MIKFILRFSIDNMYLYFVQMCRFFSLSPCSAHTDISHREDQLMSTVFSVIVLYDYLIMFQPRDSLISAHPPLPQYLTLMKFLFGIENWKEDLRNSSLNPVFSLSAQDLTQHSVPHCLIQFWVKVLTDFYFTLF